MSNSIFNPMEIDAIGEIMNISLGSSATAVSNMLDHRVDITTPKVTVVQVEDFTLGTIRPAIGVEIKYTSGLVGNNIMLLKMSDVKVLVDTLMGEVTEEEELELDDLTLSAICEVMNQMMGAASTALSDFLGKLVNISTPETFDVDNIETFKADRLPVSSGYIVMVQFALSIEGTLRSEFLNVMSVELARELLSGFDLSDYVEEEYAGPQEMVALSDRDPDEELSQEEIEKLLSSLTGSATPEEDAPTAPVTAPADGAADETPPERPAEAGTVAKQGGEEMKDFDHGSEIDGRAEAPEPPVEWQTPPPQQWDVGTGAVPSYAPPGGQTAPPQMAMPYGYYGAPPPGWQYVPIQQAPPPEPKVIVAQQPDMMQLADELLQNPEQAENLALIMGIPLEVTVEIGRSRKKVQDILSFTKGSLVVLDKLAGDQVDLFVNGKCIARGEVVVIDDNFGIRISEILRKPEIEGLVRP